MKVVADIERFLGFLSADASAQNKHYDLDSKIPVDLRDAGGTMLHFIEDEGRSKGVVSVTVTKNKILTVLNKPEQIIFAIVEVDGESTHLRY